MRQQVYMPNGHLIFDSSDPRVQYKSETLQSMITSGYLVKIDGKILRNKKRGKQ